MAAKFTVFKDKSGQYRFNLKAANGEIIATSESYSEKKSALKGIASIVKSAPVAKIVDDTGEAESPSKTGAKPAASKAKAPVKADAAPKPRGRKPKSE
ncbi:MAG: DUF1508 domain-containing protein [Spirochaetaceae bacterium]|jgi:uncharacterized protein YegP (UPF0339 family)|nr:DUF1508 domain-containing protein [Spirochaetaceae bacterium]